jgi:outer membrane scaffolding protein for murein synthesis (MipA/OmpV family)
MVAETRKDRRMKHEVQTLLAVAMTLVVHAATAGAGELAQDASASPQTTNRLPLWEAGLVGIAGRLPDYRGSDEYTLYTFPLPYVIYRGEILEADRDGVRGLFFKGRRIETDISLSGNPPVNNGNKARSGMPELNPLLEMGPVIKYFFYRGERSSGLDLEATVRGVISVDKHNLDLRYEGKRAFLTLVMTGPDTGPEVPWSAGFSAGVDFGDHEYNSYFYDVSEEQALPDRGRYRSSGGYGGLSISGYLLRELTPTFSVSVYGRWDNIDGAIYDDSPLVTIRNNFVLGAAVMWELGESERRVDRP